MDARLDSVRKLLLAFFLGCLAASLTGTLWLVYKFGIAVEAIAIALGWLAAAALALLCVERQKWVVVGLIVLLLRASMIWVTDGALSATPDPHYYATLARHISMGRDFTDVVDGVAFAAHAPRLYAILLGGTFFITGGSNLAPFLLNVVIDATTAFLIYSTARTLGAPKTPAIGAAVLYLIWPHIIVASAFVQKEGLGSLLIMACVWTLARCWDDGRMRPIQYGVFLGLLGMAQPAWFLLAAAFPLALLLRADRISVTKFLAIAALATVATLIPQIVRNYYATGSFVPLTTGFGMNLYINAAGTYDFPDHLNHLPEAAWSRAMMGEGLAIIAANPVGYMMHQAKMMFLAFALEHGQLLNLQGLSPGPRVAPTAFLLVMQIPLIALWAGAVVYLRRRPHVLLLGILGLILLYTFTISIWFEFGARHRAYLLPVLLAPLAIWLGRSSLTPQSARARAAAPAVR